VTFLYNAAEENGMVRKYGRQKALEDLYRGLCAGVAKPHPGLGGVRSEVGGGASSDKLTLAGDG
jgi:hypothetical protein